MMITLLLVLAADPSQNANALFKGPDGGWTLRTTTSSGSSSGGPSYVNALIDGGSVNVVQTTSPWVVSGTVTVGTFPDNEPVNVAQFGGSAVATGTGTGGAGIPRVTVSSDSSLT